MNDSISLITPIFNEPDVHLHLPLIDKELANTGLPYEIIAVNDGSDAITTTRLNSLNLPNLRTYTYAKNRGKGFALRYGFEVSNGDLICFMDVDLQLHPQQITLFSSLLTLLEADVVVGSKRHPLSQVEYGPYRRIYSWGFQQLIRLLFKLNITDTQVGLKLFRRHVLEKVMPKLIVKRWAFDLELLAVARHLGFTRIVEAPIHLAWKPGKSNINWKVIPGILQDTLAIFYRKNILKFYDRPSLNQPVKDQRVDVIYSAVKSAIEEPSLPAPKQSQVQSSGVIFSADRL